MRRPEERGAAPLMGVAVERREAPGPTSLGSRASQRRVWVTRPCRRRAAGRVMVRQRESRKLPGASRRSIPSFEGRKKGQGGPAPLKKSKPPGQRSVGYSRIETGMSWSKRSAPRHEGAAPDVMED